MSLCLWSLASLPGPASSCRVFLGAERGTLKGGECFINDKTQTHWVLRADSRTKIPLFKF